MKRYLIEPEFFMIHDVNPDSSTSDSALVSRQQIVYRIVDMATMQRVPHESEDIDAVASTCVQLNESSEAAVSSHSASSLPADIVQAIAINNAMSIREQPAILANLDLAQKIFNQNMQQQNAVSYQQALNQIKLAVVGKYVTMINSVGLSDQAATEKMGEEIGKLVRQLERIIGEKASDSVTRETS